MLVGINIGNTNTALGLFVDRQLIKQYRFTSERTRGADEYRAHLITQLLSDGIAISDIEQAIICSTVPKLTVTFQQVIEVLFSYLPLLVTYKCDLGLKNEYRYPEQVGSDRLVNAVAGLAEYGAPLIVLDFGTATTIDVLLPPNRFLGGVIAPGVHLGLQALVQQTALLYEIPLTPPPNVIGQSTEECMQSGIFLGYCCMVDGLVEQIWKQLGFQTRTVMTGGLAHLFLGQLHTVATIDKDLTLKGLPLIMDRNSGV